jgi:hypothetical protein
MLQQRKVMEVVLIQVSLFSFSIILYGNAGHAWTARIAPSRPPLQKAGSLDYSMGSQRKRISAKNRKSSHALSERAPILPSPSAAAQVSGLSP